MEQDNKEQTPSNLQRFYVRSDPQFIKRLKVAVAMRGGDQSDFLREAAEVYICGVFATNSGNLGIRTDSES